ncbi:sodium:solute symporter family transporter [Aurantivibrio plasticivorans]
MSGPEIFKYGLMSAYMGLVFWLSWIGMRRTRDIQGFSIGNKDMSPILVGITLAASIASTSTFVINPGFVYTHGLSAYIHYGIAAPLGILSAFLLLTKGFLRLGESNKSATIPEWIFHRYQHRGLSVFFTVINLLSIAFVVLILVGCSMLMASLFPVSEKAALIIILLLVFSYVIMGGTYAHAYTNTLQGIMMLIVTVFLFATGFKYFDGGFTKVIDAVGSGYGDIFNPESNLYFDFFSVFLSGFIVTFALMLQPHILTKVLYLRSEKDIGTFIGTTVIVGTCFTLMLLVGFYARIAGVDVSSQDAVVGEYLLHEFSHSVWGQYVLTLIFITLLAAGMSTLDGILVSLSAMVVKDIVLPFTGDATKGLFWSRITLILIGLAGAAVAWDPPPLIGLFAQKGVYGLAAASLVPILFGVLFQGRIPLWVVAIAAVMGLTIHLVLNLFGGVENPAVSSSYAILASSLFALLGMLGNKLLTSNS